ncbi:MAG: hypothetical protein IT317_05850 [Anaerolineales bacterium]|nr:hypothetical protein [Anaerolineales bacterium]
MSWVGRTGRLVNFLTAAAITTVAAGLLLFIPTSGNFSGAWLSSTHGIVLSTGAVIGLLAFFHGIFGAGAAARKSGALAKEMAAQNGPPTPEQMQLAQALGAATARHAMISLALGAVTLLFMAGAESF